MAAWQSLETARDRQPSNMRKQKAPHRGAFSKGNEQSISTLLRLLPDG
jgi:hypothetical protein